VMNADGSSPVQLTGLTDGGTSFNPLVATGRRSRSPRSGTAARALHRTRTGRGRRKSRMEGRRSTGALVTQGIVFHANASGTPAIFLVNPDTGLAQLTRGGSWSYEPRGNPDRQPNEHAVIRCVSEIDSALASDCRALRRIPLHESGAGWVATVGRPPARRSAAGGEPARRPGRSAPLALRRRV
jgi:hypothetical protein